MSSAGRRFSERPLRDVQRTGERRGWPAEHGQKAPVDMVPESSRCTHKFVADIPHVKAAKSKSLGSVAVDGRMNIIKALEAV